MENLTAAKSARLLVIYSRLVNGEIILKAELSEQYHVSERSIQRDMEALRCFIANQSLGQDIIYDYKLRGYRLVNNLPKGLSNRNPGCVQDSVGKPFHAQGRNAPDFGQAH